jgi:hypothetical protein
MVHARLTRSRRGKPTTCSEDLRVAATPMEYQVRNERLVYLSPEALRVTVIVADE